MTWIPIWSKVSNILIAPVIVPALSYGLFCYIVSGKDVDYLKQDKEEMIRWSSSLSDPKHPNYNSFDYSRFNPFDLRNN
jgi:hypothetical protein